MGTYELDARKPDTAQRPLGGAVALWHLDTDRQAVGGHPVGNALLDDAERARAAGFVRPTDRHRYLAAHVALRVLLGGYLGVAPERLEFIREECPCCGGPHGRPALAPGGPGGGPADRLHFSLSHSENIALLAFSGMPVGVDVEGVPGPAVVADLLRMLHPDETAELLALAGPEQPAALSRIWSRKEAYLKGTGTGLGFGLVEPYVGSAAAPAHTPGWVLTDVSAPPGFSAALAVAAGPQAD
ncbi:4'-phosphopantetheinyl transferase superfamily protein [Streptomyces bambusae]|uniref:4'-phosphopantetheinyl transferase family protein n=1 Tax=Streptomyces bambusae TaxID=1550616 RepID=UPI001D000138|nr:4'-phosphopantetheinyl transferase superfamily protein [Streptomyces bambusae]MCB5170292.1 4'-phosphopantetheinyl transferase superfamily protein [Streptomyces bambusae]